ncbi:MAG: class I SAM-dependent methyltransferase [Candidatus Nanoarchaeia archaeon]
MDEQEFFTLNWEMSVDKKDAKKRADYVKKYVVKYNKHANKILELGVGIGEVLVHFSKDYLVHGLDIEKECIKICRKKMPNGKFLVASMHNFKIDEKFDVIFSAQDSLNFLETFSKWESTFKNVHNHLIKNGLFIFDIYTPKVLKENKNKEVLEKVPAGFSYYKVNVKKNVLVFEEKIFEQVIGKEKTYKLHEDKFNEIIWPVSKVKKALLKYFKIVETFNLNQGLRILFICKKT